MEYLLLAVFIVALIALYISFKTKRSISGFEQVVTFFLVFISCHALYVFIYEVFNLPKYIDSAFPFGLVYGPLFYFALKTSSGNIVSVKRVFLHLVPFIVWVVCFFIFAFLPDFRASYGGVYYSALYLLISTSMIGYVSTAFFSNRKRTQSDSFNKTVRLVTVGVVILATLGLLMLTLTLTQILPRTTENRQFPRILIYVAMLMQVVAVLRYQIENLIKGVYIDVNPEVVTEEENVPLYQKSLIPDSAMDLYEEKLEKLIERKVFQDIELSLEGLARQIGAPKHHLTQLFNLRMKKTFNQYINGLRIEYACELIEQDPREFSIEDLAYKCGFNSKVSFNRNFKSITGITPSEYREPLKEGSSI